MKSFIDVSLDKEAIVAQVVSFKESVKGGKLSSEEISAELSSVGIDSSEEAVSRVRSLID